jgi:amidophosphoribosyltransferase
MGRELAREFPIKADIVVPVPDSGNCAALGYSMETGIPYEMAFVRNHYIGRSFLQPSQLIRDFNVRVKLNLIPELVKGKRVIIVDDSIVHVQSAREQFERSRGHRSSCPCELSAPHESMCLRH